MSDLGGAIRSIEELVEEAVRLNVLLVGTDANPGLLIQTKQVSDSLTEVAGHLASAAQLSEQLDALPERLLRSADDMQFRAALRESIAQVLADAIVDAKLRVEQESTEAAVAGLVNQIKGAMAQLGESSANYFAERNQFRGQLDAEKVKSTALTERLTYFEQDKDTALRQMTANFAATAQRTGTARWIDLCAGLAIGVVVSLSVLVPMASQYLSQQIHANQQR